MIPYDALGDYAYFVVVPGDNSSYTRLDFINF